MGRRHEDGGLTPISSRAVTRKTYDPDAIRDKFESTKKVRKIECLKF